MARPKPEYSATDRRRLKAAQVRARAAGYDAFMPNRRRAQTQSEPERFSIGATCYCQGPPPKEPQVLKLDLGDAKQCPLCGALFYRLEDDTGIAIKHRPWESV